MLLEEIRIECKIFGVYVNDLDTYTLRRSRALFLNIILIKNIPYNNPHVTAVADIAGCSCRAFLSIKIQ